MKLEVIDASKAQHSANFANKVSDFCYNSKLSIGYTFIEVGRIC